MPPRFWFLSSLHGSMKPSTQNCKKEQESSIFVSETNKISILFLINALSISNLFLNEFVLIWQTISLLGLLHLTSLRLSKLYFIKSIRIQEWNLLKRNGLICVFNSLSHTRRKLISMWPGRGFQSLWLSKLDLSTQLNKRLRCVET